MVSRQSEMRDVISRSSLVRPFIASHTHGRELASGGLREVVTLGDRRVLLRLESPESVNRLKHLPLEGLMSFEDLLFESFEEDDMEGEMQLLTATDVETNNLVGLVFWRDLPEEEMHEWLEQNHPVSPPGAGAGAPPVEESGWVKIELLGTDRSYRGHGIAKLLLASVLAYETAGRGMRHAILQVAGGETNVAADHLYKSFGFEMPPGGYFEGAQPNLRVVWDMPHGLRALAGHQKYPALLRDRLGGSHKWRKLGVKVDVPPQPLEETRPPRPRVSLLPPRGRRIGSPLMLTAASTLAVGVASFLAARRFSSRSTSSSVGIALVTAGATGVAVAAAIRLAHGRRRRPLFSDLIKEPAAELKARLTSHGGEPKECVEKADLVRRLIELVRQGSER